MKNGKYPVKIIQLLNYLGFGGAENVVFNYATVLSEMGVENYVLGINKEKKYIEKLKKYSKVLITDNYFTYFLKLLKVDDKKTILFTNSTITLFFGIILKVLKKSKLVYIQHLYFSSKTKRRLIYFLVNIFVDKFIVVSPKIIDIAKKEIKSFKIFFLLNFFNEKEINKKHNELLENYKKFLEQKKKEGFLIIVSSSPFRKGKNLEMLPEICKYLKERPENPKVLFLVLGDGLLRPAVYEKVKKYKLQNYFLFTGYVDNVIDYIKEADLYLFLSNAEMLSMALIEAMSVGVSIVAVEESNSKFILGSKGIYAKLNTKDIADKILKFKEKILLDENLSNNLKLFFKERFSRLFSYKRGYKDIEFLLKEIIKKSI